MEVQIVPRRLAVPAALLALLLFAAPSASAAVGDLSLLPDPGGCVTDTGSSDGGVHTCGTLPLVPNSSIYDDGTHQGTGKAAAESPDGTQMYLAGNGRLDVLERDSATGAWAKVWCYDAMTANDAEGQRCPTADDDSVAPVFQPVGVAAADDDVYVATDASVGFFASSMLVHFKRQPDGSFARLDCLGTGAGTACGDGRGSSANGANNSVTMVVSPNGKQIFVGNGFGAIYAYDRDPATGAISQGAQPDCATADGSDGCLRPKGVGTQVRKLDVSPDGKQLYVAGDHGLAVLDVDATTGALTQRDGNCVSSATSSTPSDDNYHCQVDTRLQVPQDVEVSADGTRVYVVSRPNSWSAINVLGRRADGTLDPTALGAGACLYGGSGVTGCAFVPEANDVSQLTLAPDGKNLYTVNAGASHDTVRGWSVATTGALTPVAGQHGCATISGSSGDCLRHDMRLGTSVFALSPDGAHLDLGGGNYRGSSYAPLILTLAREAPPKPDTASPQITIATPPLAKATYVKGQAVKAAYSCTDDVAIASCSGPVAKGANLPTGTLGTNVPFKVTAVDKAGHTTTATHFYDVVAAPAKDTTKPTITIAAPLDGAAFTAPAAPAARYACADASGIRSCAGSVPNGAKVSTLALIGSLTVAAVDTAGNVATRTVFYSVLPSPGASLPPALKTAGAPALSGVKKAPSAISGGALTGKGSPVTLPGMPAGSIGGASLLMPLRPNGVIAPGGANVIAAGGGNVVAAGGGNVIAAGGGNVVAAGGGNVVAAGGGNVVAAGGGNVVAAGGLNRLAGVRATAARRPGRVRLVPIALARRTAARRGPLGLRLKAGRGGRTQLAKAFRKPGRQTVALILAVTVRRPGTKLPAVTVLKTVRVREAARKR